MPHGDSTSSNIAKLIQRSDEVRSRSHQIREDLKRARRLNQDAGSSVTNPEFVERKRAEPDTNARKTEETSANDSGEEGDQTPLGHPTSDPEDMQATLTDPRYYWLTAQALAKYLSLSDRTIRNYVKQGMPHRRVGRAYRFRLVDVEPWIDALPSCSGDGNPPSEAKPWPPRKPRRPAS